jgi:prepilin-type N-terminal cleavage/methylation domain-containing protein
MRKNSGFSLTELLVVTAVIAIIVSNGIPGLLSYR